MNQIILLFIILIITTQANKISPTLWDTDNRGPFLVGYQPDNTMYDKESEKKLEYYKLPGVDYCETDKGRLISYSIYYPIDKEESKGKSQPKAIPDYLSEYFKAKGVDGTDINAYKGAYLDTKISLKNNENYPIVFFSSGQGCIHHQYSSFIEYITSYGYIVVALEHQYSTIIYNPDTKCVAPEIDLDTYKSYDKAINYLHESGEQETYDFNYFLRNYDRTHPILKYADFSKLTMFGHSLGGMTAFNFCSQNPYICKAAINLDGYNASIRGAYPFSDKIKTLKLAAINEFGYSDIELKALVDEDRLYQNSYYGRCDNSDHMSFTDNYYVFPNPKYEQPSVFHPKISKTILNFIEFSLGKRNSYSDNQEGIQFMDSQQIKEYVEKLDNSQILQKQ